MIQFSSWGHASSLCSVFPASSQGCAAWQSLLSKDECSIQSSWRTGPRGRAPCPAWGPLLCAPGTAQALALPTCTPSPSTARAAKEGSSSPDGGMGRYVWQTGTCQRWRAHPACPSCPDTSSSLPPARDPAALWLALSTPAWISSRERRHVPRARSSSRGDRKGAGRHHSPIPL